MPPRHRDTASVALACTAAAAMPGCTTFVGGSTGIVGSLSGQRGLVGVASEAHFGALEGRAGQPGGMWGLGGDLRTKFTPRLDQVSAGYSLLGVFPLGHVAYLRLQGGLQLLQFESLDSRFVFGSFSPLFDLGLGFRLFGDFDSAVHSGLLFTVSGSIEYDVRFGTPSDGFASGTLGMAWIFGGH